MGTLVRITVVSGNARGSDRAIKAAFSVMAKIDALMSTYKQSSEISRLNRSGKKTFRVDPMTFEVIQRGLYWGRASGGVFDITVGKMKKLYNLDTKGDVPERGAIKRGMQSVGYDFIQLATPDQVTLPVAGMSIDLGGIAKGYAVEQALLSIQKEGVFSAMVNAGGDIGTIGTKMGEDWKVGILHPRKQEELLGVLGVQNCFVATSGDYMQFTEKEGRRYSHIIDPRSGSASPGKMSVTVIAGSGADADALATTLFVMKKDEGLKLVEKIANVEAMLVTKNGEIFYSSGFKGFLVQK
ncbi:MAG: FAD:protein FMN transferase [Nitrospinota bacterium]